MAGFCEREANHSEWHGCKTRDMSCVWPWGACQGFA